MPRPAPPPEQVLMASATRWRKCAAKHEARAAEYRQRADESERRFVAWREANDDSSPRLPAGGRKRASS